MWLFTDIGFFSVVRNRNNPSRLIVRARSEVDIKRLVSRHGHSLDLTELDVVYTPFADYSCRVEVSVLPWSAVLAQLTQDIDYDNFKDCVHRRQGVDRAMLYSQVWSTMLSLQGSPDSYEKIQLEHAVPAVIG